MEKGSQTLYEELKRLEATFPAIEAGELAALDDPGHKDLIVRLTLATHLFGSNDARVKALQASVETVKQAFRAPRLAYNQEHAGLSSEIRALTEPVIKGAVRMLSEALQDVKLEESVLGRASAGFDMVPKLTVSTNRPAILEGRRMVNEAVEALKKMNLKPIVEIRTFVQDRIAEIQKISFSPCSETVTDADYNRIQFLEKGIEA